MSTSEPQPPEFSAVFMEDYYAEADEHLVSLRRMLLALETAIGGDAPPAVLEELFRRFHSLKGISAMVELREAELLAHHMESVLRALRQQSLTLTSDGFETLVEGVNVLEEVIAARRAGTAMPSIDRHIDALAALGRQAGDTGGSASPAAAGAGAAAGAPYRKVWRVTFVPSPALVERGVKVDTVRARLSEVGQVLSVAPRVLEGGRISFEFQIQLDDERLLEEWRDDGVTYELIPAAPDETRAPVPSEAAGADRQRLRVAEQVPDSRVAANLVRVDLARLDELMRLVGDLVVTRARLDDTLQRIEKRVPSHEWRALQEHSARLERHLRDLREGVMRVRLVPVGEIFRRMPFVVRDLARDLDKRVRLELAGQSTEIDKFLIERMMDPVLHLVRNGISHGIETPEQRLAAGKPLEGRIRLAASTAGESVVIEIADDGAGIDVADVTDRARRAGLIAAADMPDSRMLLDILCASGFSTRDEADRASGRGVGLAVVRTAVQDLGGTLAVDSERGRGTTFTITLPLTLAITDAIIAHVGDQIYAVPQTTVRELIEVDATALRAIEGNELIVHRGATLPVVRLGRLFGVSGAPLSRLHAIVVGSGASAVGLLVDRIAGQQEIVVKTIVDPLIHVEGVSGATELGDGRLVLILDVVALSRTLRGRSRAVEGAA